MISATVVSRGGASVEKVIRAKQAQIARNKERAARAAANALKVEMKRQAPYETKRDSTAAKSRIPHLRSTIRVTRKIGGWAVGPHSPVAHLVIRGAQRGKIETVSMAGGKHALRLAGRRQIRAHARGQVGPVGQAHALMISSGGEVYFRSSARPGPMPANAFVARTRELAGGEAKAIAGAVLFHDALDPNEGA